MANPVDPELNPRPPGHPHTTPLPPTQETPLPFQSGETSAYEVAERQSVGRVMIGKEARFLLIIQHQEGMRTVDLNDVVETLGRSSDNSIQIQDRFLSRHHAHLVRVPDPQTDSYTYCVFDGGREIRTPSKNGVYVNGMQVRSHLLRAGDVVFLGPSVRLFFYPLAAAEMLLKEPETDPALLSLKR